MSIDFAALIFPNNVVKKVADYFQIIDAPADRLTVLKRPLRTSDPNYSIGVWGERWEPDTTSYEMIGVDFARTPTLERYLVTIQAFVRDADEINGLIAHAVLAETIRTTLGSDATLRAQLGGLQATLNGTTKSLKKFYVRAGRYISNNVNGENLYLSTNDLMLEVEKLS